MEKATNKSIWQKILIWMPGLATMLHYKRHYFGNDVKAGLSVAAVSLPVSIAYAELTGVGAIAGLYSTILPLIVYALFGSSRQLIVGPDTATCAVVAAVVFPLAANDPILRWQLVVILTIMIGIWCIIAGKLHLGALADLLSQPILIGLLNGISITIMVDQLAKALGFRYDYSYLIERVVYFPFKISQIHLLTTFVSFLTLVILVGLKRIRPRYPAPLFAVVIMTFLSWLFNFDSYNVRIIGDVTSDFIPMESWIDFDKGLMRDLVVPSLNIAIICFVSMMITVRSFASKNNYETNADVEFKALGMANIAAGLSQGFVVSGTSSRTAVNDANGGKTQLVSIIAAIIIGLVVLLFLSPLKYIPTCVLGVILIYSSISLINFQTIKRFFKFDRDAFYLSLTTFISVLVIGIIPGMALAVLLGLFLFLRRVFRPKDQLLGMDESGRIHSIGQDVQPLKNTLIYRFNSPLTYFNIAYFKRRIISYIDESEEPINYVIVDAIPCFTYKDVSVLSGIDELVKSLKVRNVTLILSGRRKTLKNWFKQMNIKPDSHYLDFAYDLYFAVRLVQSKEHMENKTEDEIDDD
ncbi:MULTISPECIES: SulP family inorganic anion transporter [unclassified Gilliamella]|uniref:SulP family inorganic anion transporter n=1 Tax=unclassified Gilliamella TaxID=2685620 RepID=UPI001C6A33B9|nr:MULTISPECIES: SulP family inorganic anion transporter [unclassified Gilliamella]MCX8600722.1 SulP family inorganic anion transporter [Gilliamella sp. B3722]MCX8607858.1 SulP family inorganic anion transporter [Gilliamella sp. B3771]MCX8609939.1 SulP family inorganic anion transporter [Gilliamella sp. B3891]MCX8611971.1 SulP family inorganic anion transporter [Gilliamella sp. B3773]MCX8614964.1 SulP family inorganic anion transporter [Gilliamella sp. B3770]